MTGGETRGGTRDAPVLPFVLAVVVPLVGFVLGVIEAAKRSTARGAAIMLVAVVAACGWGVVVYELTRPDAGQSETGYEIRDGKLVAK